MTLRMALIANFAVEWGTGNDLKDTIERLGGVVEPVQEQQEALWHSLIGLIRAGNGPDAVIWNRTPTLSAVVARKPAKRCCSSAATGRNSDHRLPSRPLVGPETGTGGLQRPLFPLPVRVHRRRARPGRWKAAEVNHFWSPPAIAERNCVKALARPPVAGRYRLHRHLGALSPRMGAPRRDDRLDEALFRQDGW